MFLQAPRPGLKVSLLSDATDRVEGYPGATASLLASGGECERALVRTGA
jgi:hypothetical protein